VEKTRDYYLKIVNLLSLLVLSLEKSGITNQTKTGDQISDI
jgi:hypothetical protein